MIVFDEIATFDMFSPYRLKFRMPLKLAVELDVNVLPNVAGLENVVVLWKVPVPVPSLVLVAKETVGIVSVLQTTPLAVIGDPPSEVMFPPDFAPIADTSVTEVVDSLGPLTVFTITSLEYRVDFPT